MSPQNLSSLATRIAHCPVAIIGDVMLDHFLIGHADRISPEAPVPIVRLEREEFRLGGAANVAANVASLGGAPRLAGVIGNDDAAAMLKTTLRAAGISDAGLVTDASRRTTEKLRAVTERHLQVARIDRESSSPLVDDVLTRFLVAIGTLSPAKAVVLSDYAKGVVTEEVVAAAAALARANHCPLLVDPKHPHAGYYHGATVITPNHREAETMSGHAIRSQDDARKAAGLIHDASGASVLITRGEHGMYVFDMMTGTLQESLIPAAAREVADVTGAGDTVIAALALGLAAGGSLADAADFANRAAGAAVSRFGTAAVALSDL
jgi:D-beta-D-heptose 7-phosphate kinase/D-beta-D-heptose 1-phosphate adenosyltransferase